MRLQLLLCVIRYQIEIDSVRKVLFTSSCHGNWSRALMQFTPFNVYSPRIKEYDTWPGLTPYCQSNKYSMEGGGRGRVYKVLPFVYNLDKKGTPFIHLPTLDCFPCRLEQS